MMEHQAQAGLGTTGKEKMSSFDEIRYFLDVMKRIYEVKETCEMIIASGGHISLEHIIHYEARLFKEEAQDWWLSP